MVTAGDPVVAAATSYPLKYLIITTPFPPFPPLPVPDPP
jgi:hypothetical protein